MDGKNIILKLIISAILVYGVIGDANVLPEDSSSEQLKANQKLPVKTVTSEHGDVYDCIDFYDQPAFDDPLLKKHEHHFDMKPSFLAKEVLEKTEKGPEWKGVGCPRGTVPIRRENRTEERPSPLTSQTDDSSLVFYAGTATKNGLGKLYGAFSFLYVDNPRVYDGSQFSSNIISVEAGEEQIHAGWTVNPELYGDYNTRFYVWVRGAKVSCHNTKCPGFVLTNNETPLDRILKNFNSGNDDKHETRVFIRQDKESGRWWLVENYGNPMGFWPRHMFNKLSDGAYKVFFGGVVKASPGRTSFPQMGMGNRPHNDKVRGNGVSRHMSIINQDGVEEYAASNSDILETLSERYVARNLHMHWWNRQKVFSSTLLYGGA